MRLGLVLPVFTADAKRPIGVADRAQGFDAVFAADHVFPPGQPGRPAVEAFSLLSAVAASHPGLGVGVLVTRASMRPAGILAKLAAGLHHVSGGRAIVGLGLGDAAGRAEHEALGIAYPDVAERAVALEETCLALRALFDGSGWPGGTVVGPIPGPVLPPADPPVWVGGISDRVLAIAARAANGWNGWGLPADGFAARAADLARLVTEAGRDPLEVMPTWGGIALVGSDAADLAALEAERAAKGRSMEVWRGTIADLRAFADEVRAAGAGWFIVAAAGPPDRPAVIAEALGT
jgi:alkanesulfonate monooxygenase SsuD/methylene tetrahydromethanopterin reductase-like flavin-dependent oxidoreductase (luciferase family)